MLKLYKITSLFFDIPYFPLHILNYLGSELLQQLLKKN